MQGFGKFGFYEVFKDVYKGIVGPERAAKYQTIGFAFSSACAEFIADIFLCPMEACKVRVQTDITGKVPKSLPKLWNSIFKKEGWAGMYSGIVPLWCRQIPYTIVKFVGFERTVRFAYRNLPKDKDEYSKSFQLLITFLSGYWAGIFCAIVSHPADTMVSKINSLPNDGRSVGQKAGKIYKKIGFKGLWNGLGVRIIMIGTLTGLQWYIYDSFKVATGLQSSGK